MKAELADHGEKGLASPARPSARQRAPKSARKANQKADEDIEGLVECEEGPVSDEALESKPPCPGCQRHVLSGRCYLRLGSRVQWALPGGRGGWCKDCFGCWRLVFQKMCNLVVFANYIRSQEGCEEWTLCFLAYMSLRREGVERLSDVVVTARKESLSWCFRMLCLPVGPFQVVKLRNILDRSGMVPARLVIMDDGSSEAPKYCLGYLQSMASPCGDRSIWRPTPSDSSDFVWFTKQLGTDCAEDVDLLASAFGEPAIPPSASSNGTREEAPTQLVLYSPGKKAEHRVEAQMNWVRTLLEPFTHANWMAVKESQFTATMNKLNDLKTDLAGQGKDESVGAVESLCDGYSQSKMFVKRFRDYHKNQKFGKLSSLSPHLMSHIIFMEKHKLKPHVSLMQLYLKVVMVVTPGEWSVKLGEMIKKGLQETLAAIPVGEEVDGESWLRACLCQQVASDIENTHVADCEARRKPIHEACGDMISMLGALPNAATLQPLCKDINALQTMFAAGLGDRRITVREASACQKTLTDARLTLLQPALQQSAAGQEYMSCIGELLKRSAGDTVADDRFQLAVDTVSGEGMINLHVSEPDPTDLHDSMVYFKNASFLFSGDALVWNALVDIIQYATDACKTWSQARQHEKVDDITKLVNEACDVVDLVDVGMSWLAIDIVQGLLKTIADQAADGFPNVALAHSHGSCTTGTTRAILMQTADFAGGQKRCMQQMLAFATGCLEENLEAKARLNSCVRNSNEDGIRLKRLMSAVDILAEIAPQVIEANVPTLIAEWKVNFEESCLAKVLKLVTLIVELEKGGDMSFGSTFCSMETSIAFMGDDGSTNDDIAYTFGCMKGLPTMLAHSVVCEKIRNLLKMSVSGVVDGFAEVVHVEGFRQVPPVADWSQDSFDKLVASIIDAESMHSCKLAAVRECRTSSEADPVFPGKKAYDIMSKLCTLDKVEKADVLTHLAEQSSSDAPLNEVLAMCTLYLCMHDVSSVFLMLGVEAKTLRDFFVDGKLRDPLIKYVEFAERRCNELLAVVMTDENLYKSAEALDVKWKYSVAMCLAWAKRSLLLVGELRKRVHHESMMLIEKVALDVEKKTPRYDHFCNSKTFVESLAKRHLLQSPARATLSDEVVKLFHCIAQATAFEKVHGIPESKADARYKEICKHADVTFDSGKLAVTVIAACHVALCMSGDQ